MKLSLEVSAACREAEDARFAGGSTLRGPWDETHHSDHAPAVWQEPASVEQDDATPDAGAAPKRHAEAERTRVACTLAGHLPHLRPVPRSNGGPVPRRGIHVGPPPSHKTGAR